MKRIITATVLAFCLARTAEGQWIRQNVHDKMDDSSGLVFASISKSQTLTLLIDCRPPANGRLSLGTQRPFSITHAHDLVMSTRVRIDQKPPRAISWKLTDATFAIQPNARQSKELVDAFKGATSALVEVTYAGGSVVVETFNVTGVHACN